MLIYLPLLFSFNFIHCHSSQHFPNRLKTFLLLGKGAAGKSSFCNSLKGVDIAKIRPLSSPVPATIDCQLISVFHEQLFNGVPLLLVDTPSIKLDDPNSLQVIKRHVHDLLVDLQWNQIDGIILFESAKDHNPSDFNEFIKSIHGTFPNLAYSLTLMITMSNITKVSQNIVDEIQKAAARYGIRTMTWDCYDHLMFCVDSGFSAIPVNKEKHCNQLVSLNNLLTVTNSYIE
jgi:hypothetical protein